MNPVQDPEIYVFVTLSPEDLSDALLRAARGMFCEDEGISLILPQQTAQAHGLTFAAAPAMSRITLSVHSALDGVGLTAAVAGALAAQGIACNMVAAYHHDHVFVPLEQTDQALQILSDLQTRHQV